MSRRAEACRPALSRPLTLQARQRVADGAGGYTETWSNLGTLWAELSARSGSLRPGEAVALASVAWRVVVRAAPEGSSMRPVPGQRLLDGARVLAIEAVAETDGSGRYLTCFCREEAAQ